MAVILTFVLLVVGLLALAPQGTRSVPSVSSIDTASGRGCGTTIMLLVIWILLLLLRLSV